MKVEPLYGGQMNLNRMIMINRKAFALRLKEEVFIEVEKWAKEEYRSTNGQIEWMLTKLLKDAQRLPLKKNEEI